MEKWIISEQSLRTAAESHGVRDDFSDLDISQRLARLEYERNRYDLEKQEQVRHGNTIGGVRVIKPGIRLR